MGREREKLEELIASVGRYYSALLREIEQYEKQACKEVDEYDRAGAEESTIELGSAMVPVGLALKTFARLLQRPRCKVAPFGLYSLMDMKKEIIVLEEFLTSLSGAELPECPEPVSSWLGKKSSAKKTKKEDRKKT